MKQLILLTNGVVGGIRHQADPINLEDPLQMELKRTPLCGTPSAQPTNHDTSFSRDACIHLQLATRGHIFFGKHSRTSVRQGQQRLCVATKLQQARLSARRSICFSLAPYGD